MAMDSPKESARCLHSGKKQTSSSAFGSWSMPTRSRSSRRRAGSSVPAPPCTASEARSRRGLAGARESTSGTQRADPRRGGGAPGASRTARSDPDRPRSRVLRGRHEGRRDEGTRGKEETGVPRWPLRGIASPQRASRQAQSHGSALLGDHQRRVTSGGGPGGRLKHHHELATRAGSGEVISTGTRGRVNLKVAPRPC